MEKVQAVAGWILRVGLRDFLSELTPVLLPFESKLDSLSKEDLDQIQSKISKKAFKSLQSKCRSAGDDKKKKKVKEVTAAELPQPVELTHNDFDLKVDINRAPVFQLWAICALKRLGYNDVEALAISGELVHVTSQQKKRSLGFRFVDEPTTTSAGGGEQMNAFGEENLGKFYSAMQQLCSKFKEEELLNERGYQEYERFRPKIRGGVDGWGEKNHFKLSDVITPPS